jgi:hypothetical protein
MKTLLVLLLATGVHAQGRLDPVRELERFVSARKAQVAAFLAEYEATPYHRRQVHEMRERAKRVTGKADFDGLIGYLTHSIEEMLRQKHAALGRPPTPEERAEAYNEARIALLDLLERRILRGNALLSRSGPLSAGR